MKYIHDEIIHNHVDPAILVPIFLNLFRPASVCDIGCGTGNFLQAFKTNGIPKVLGLDGAWANKELISKHLTDTEFRTVDFEGLLPIFSEKFDLSLCLEVAEHISERNADSFIEFLIRTANSIIFSAAIPGQGGYNHLNEQWEEYWEEKFLKAGYRKYDVIRHLIINNTSVSWWYRQNIVVYSRNNLDHLPKIELSNIVVRENYFNKLIQINNQNIFINHLQNKA